MQYNPEQYNPEYDTPEQHAEYVLWSSRFKELFAQEWANFPNWTAKAAQGAELNLDTPAAQIAVLLPKGLNLAEKDPQAFVRALSATQRAAFRLITEMVHAHLSKH